MYLRVYVSTPTLFRVKNDRVLREIRAFISRMALFDDDLDESYYFGDVHDEIPAAQLPAVGSCKFVL